MRHVASFAALAIAALLAGCELVGGAPGAGPIPVPAGAESARVERVVDGDTIRLEGFDEAARIVGVDAAELRGGECYSREATRFARRLVAGERVRYALARDPRDRHGRLLIDVWLADGRMLAQELVEGGYGEVLVIAPNTRYAEPLERAEASARRAERGLWGECR